MEPTQTIEATLVDSIITPIEVYVAGENVPATSPPADVIEPGQALAPAFDVEQVIAQFLEWVRLEANEGKASPATMRSYLADVRQHLRWLVANRVGIPDVTERTLKQYRNELALPGTPARLEPGNDRAPERYANTTIGRKIASVRQFYLMAAATGLIETNPALRLQAPKDKTGRHARIKWFEDDERRRIMKAVSGWKPNHIRNKAMIALMMNLGLRVSEVSKLDLEHFDPTGAECGSLFIKAAKGDKDRMVPLTANTRSVLDKWLAVRDVMKLNTPAVFVTMHENHRQGTQPPGERIEPRGIRCMFDEVLKKTGLKKPGRSCHALRHTAATGMLLADADIHDVGLLLGHSSDATTRVYEDVVRIVKNNPAKRLDHWLE